MFSCLSRLSSVCCALYRTGDVLKPQVFPSAHALQINVFVHIPVMSLLSLLCQHETSFSNPNLT